MDLHPNCQPLSFLLGTWNGEGEGDYPTIDAFRYTEEVAFTHVGKPFLAYTQKTRHASTGEPLHAEAGYLRAVGGGVVEFVVAQPSGIVELHHGTVNGLVLELELEGVHTTRAAKSVTDVRRELQVQTIGEESVLRYDVTMAAVGEPMTHHLHGELTRQTTL